MIATTWLNSWSSVIICQNLFPGTRQTKWAYPCLFQVFEHGPNLRHCTHFTAPYSVLDGESCLCEVPFGLSYCTAIHNPQTECGGSQLPRASLPTVRGDNPRGLQTGLIHGEMSVTQEPFVIWPMFPLLNRRAMMAFWIPWLSLSTQIPYLTAVKRLGSSPSRPQRFTLLCTICCNTARPFSHFNWSLDLWPVC